MCVKIEGEGDLLACVFKSKYVGPFGKKERQMAVGFFVHIP